jgi:hypothetical protein
MIEFLALICAGVCAVAKGPQAYREVRSGLGTFKTWWNETGRELVRRIGEKLQQRLLSMIRGLLSMIRRK